MEGDNARDQTHKTRGKDPWGKNIHRTAALQGRGTAKRAAKHTRTFGVTPNPQAQKKEEVS